MGIHTHDRKSEHCTMRAPAVLKASMFIPKSLQYWRTPDVPMRRCHWCASGPRPLREMGVHMVGPMRWYFCTDECCAEWEARRYDADVRAWLQHPTGVRAKVLGDELDATDKETAACRRSLTGLRSESRLALSMRQNA